MTIPDIRYFGDSDTWEKLPGAVAVDVVACGGGGSGLAVPGGDGQLTVRRFAAADLPDVVKVTVGAGGQPSGQPGYVLVITHLADPCACGHPPHPWGTCIINPACFCMQFTVEERRR